MVPMFQICTDGCICRFIIVVVAGVLIKGVFWPGCSELAGSEESWLSCERGSDGHERLVLVFLLPVLPTPQVFS